MNRASTLRLLRNALASVCAALLTWPLPAAAGVMQQTTTAIPLDDAVVGGGLVVMEAKAQTLRPAPLPNQDIAAPGDARSQAEARLAPGIFNPKTHFAGDGYAVGSSIEGDQNHRHSTGGGMNLSIPMQ